MCIIINISSFKKSCIENKNTQPYYSECNGMLIAKQTGEETC